MATFDSVVIEGGDGTGKSFCLKSLAKALESLGGVRLDPYSQAVDWTNFNQKQDLPTKKEWFLSQKKDSAQFYFLTLSEPSKDEGIEAFLRDVFLESPNADIFNDSIYTGFYNNSRRITYWSYLQAAQYIDNCIFIADRCGLTTETMQPIDRLKKHLINLKKIIGKKNIRDLNDIKGTVAFAISKLNNIEVEDKNAKYLKNELSQLSVLPQVQEVLNMQYQGDIETLISNGLKNWNNFLSEISVGQDAIRSSNVRNYGVLYPKKIIITDIPYPTRISQVRSLLRLGQKGRFNFRDREPKWVLQSIASLYRQIPLNWSKVNISYINTYTDIVKMQTRVRNSFVQFILEGPLANKFNELGIYSARDFIKKTESSLIQINNKMRGFEQKEIETIAKSFNVPVEKLNILKEALPVREADEKLRSALEVPGYYQGEIDIMKSWLNRGIEPIRTTFVK